MTADIITDERYNLEIIEETSLVVKLSGIIAVTALNGSSHDHDNKAVLDQFGEANGQPTYNNQIIYTQPAIIDGGTF